MCIGTYTVISCQFLSILCRPSELSSVNPFAMPPRLSTSCVSRSEKDSQRNWIRTSARCRLWARPSEVMQSEKISPRLAARLLRCLVLLSRAWAECRICPGRIGASYRLMWAKYVWNSPVGCSYCSATGWATTLVHVNGVLDARCSTKGRLIIAPTCLPPFWHTSFFFRLVLYEQNNVFSRDI